MACTSAGGGRTAVFPVGLRVLVVDDDVICLRVLEQMLRKCLYIVTSCSQAKVAISLLRERKGCFDLVLSDVHMPDMDGFSLLELVGLEMDLPVIMMSADGRTNLVMRGIEHGACDYLIKPIRDEELKNIWQHVVRKRWNGIKEHEQSSAVDSHDRKKRFADNVDCSSPANEGSDEALKAQRKRREPNNDQEDDSDMENDDSTTEAVPKRILELMNVPGLTRENVASHLQKFRLYLKRLSGSYCMPVNQSLDMQLPQQTLSVLHSDFLSRTRGSLDQLNLLRPSLPSQPLIKCSSDISRTISSQPFIACWSEMVAEGNLGSVADDHDNTLISFAQQQQHWQERPQKQPGIVEPIRAINVQPSCLVVPSDFRGGQNLSFRNHGNNLQDLSFSSTFCDAVPQKDFNVQYVRSSQGLSGNPLYAVGKGVKFAEEGERHELLMTSNGGNSKVKKEMNRDLMEAVKFFPQTI